VPHDLEDDLMKIRFGAVCGLVAAGLVAMVVFQGCGQQQPAQPAADQNQQGRWQIFATGNGTFLVDTQTGDTWLYANLIWLSTAKAQLPQDLYQRALNALFSQPPGVGTMTPGMTETPGVTPGGAR
jgi:hypothetical protein